MNVVLSTAILVESSNFVHSHGEDGEADSVLRPAFLNILATFEMLPGSTSLLSVRMVI